LQEENRILLEQLGGKPRRFTDAQRIRLARKAKPVGRRRLLVLGTIVTPDTLLRWFQMLVARSGLTPERRSEQTLGEARSGEARLEADGRESELG